LPHAGGAGNNADVFNPLGAPATPNDTSLLDQDVGSGSSVLFLKNPGNFQTPNDIVRITEGTQVEIRRIGDLGTLPLADHAYGDYPTGSIVDQVTLTDAPAPDNDKQLANTAHAGSTVIELLDRNGLNDGDVIRIGALGRPHVGPPHARSSVGLAAPRR
jgi:hypothetical protein